jgi:hypothetical protein
VPTSPPPHATLDGPRALEVLASLDAQLGTVDPDARALTALTPGEGGAVALTPVDLGEDGVLAIPGDTIALVVVTSEDVRLDDADEVVQLQQLVAILPDGTEAGIVRVGDDPTPRSWSTDDPAGADAAGDDAPVAEGGAATSDDTATRDAAATGDAAASGDADAAHVAHGLRPRDVTANSARRALGLPSLADVPPIEDLLARAWLLLVAEEGLARFDTPDGPREVEPEEVAHLAGADPVSGLCTGEGEDGGTERIPSWEEVRTAASTGELHLANYTVEPAHAAWLDAAGFAQVVDRTLPSTEQLLGTLRIVGEDPLVGWAIDHIAARGWGRAL